ncbi:MAG: glycosyltransferase family 2 protein [Proteobacteria bacterium]|nr:glycosyltransferase family 2 protein [Pseudomonadota bacterium]MDA0927246.1 glycosyltransferase family 2 protein [Pseudomonadota bacterium]
MTVKPRLAILLSTWNGANFLAEQLDSLFTQTYEDFVVVVRDDGSSDNTLAVLGDYKSREPDRLQLVESESGNLGARDSFAFLVNHVLQHKAELGLESAYMLFCDQDDVWYPQKVETEWQAMLEAEQGNHAIPVLVHSDLQVVSDTLQPVAPSLARYQGLETTRNGFNQMVISNLVTGCTALINEALARKSLPVSANAIMHDWWLALVAAAFGKVVYLDQALIHYRQHGRNTIGAKEHKQAVATQPGFWTRLLHLQPNKHLWEVARQARDFMARYGDELTPHQRRGLRLAAKMDVQMGTLQRIYYRRARRY